MSLRRNFSAHWHLAAKVSLLALVIGSSPAKAAGQSLQITYGAKAIQTLAYAGVTLEDVRVYPADSFHIWHSKSTDLRGKVMPGWGENNNGEAWDPVTHTETYLFPWGTIATEFAQHGNTLDVRVVENNHSDSGIVFDGAEIFPFALHFPHDSCGLLGSQSNARHHDWTRRECSRFRPRCRHRGPSR